MMNLPQRHILSQALRNKGKRGYATNFFTTFLWVISEILSREMLIWPTMTTPTSQYIQETKEAEDYQ
jgi:hypothetical protein